MPKTIYASRLAKAMKKTVFHVDDMTALGVPAGYARLRLHKMQASGMISRVERGKYTTSDNALAVATHLTEPCYLALWSAMSFRGLTTQIPPSIQVVTSRRRFAQRLNFRGSQIRFHILSPKMIFGYENIPSEDGTRVPVAKAEKIIVDAIYTREIPMGELGEAIEASDRDLLADYVKLTGNRRVIRAVAELMRC